MRGEPKRAGNLLLVVSIVGAILGMEIDVISGPLVPDSFSLILCDLYTPDQQNPGSRNDAIFPLIPIGGHAGRLAGEDADGLGETPSVFGDVAWPSPLISASRAREAFPSVATGAVAGTLPARTLSTQTPTSPRTLPRPSNRSVELCRLLC